METGQLMERFRHLSRDLQNSLQMAQKIASGMRASEISGAGELESHLDKARGAWEDFAGWVLVSNLDDVDGARSNSVSGLVDARSKVTRSIKKWQALSKASSIKFDISRCESIAFETYIPYFEQLLDLLVGNAVKYSPTAGHVEVSASRKSSAFENGIVFTIASVGPLVARPEISQLGNKEFRAAEAIKAKVGGQGFGLFNVKRIAELLGARVSFSPSQKHGFDLNGICYSEFLVRVTFPETP